MTGGLLKASCFLLCFLAFVSIGNAQGIAHVNSISGNGTSHSVGRIQYEDGSYSFCESYMNGKTGRRWSRMYTSLDGKWTYYGDHPKARSKAERTQRTPQQIQPTNAKAVWIKNPFFEAG